MFEVFNVANTWSAISFSTTQAYQERSMVISPTPIGGPSANQGYPDGTQAHRKQASLRLVFLTTLKRLGRGWPNSITSQGQAP